MEKRKKFPNTLLIVSVILIIFVILTWIISAGEFDRTEMDGTTKQIDMSQFSKGVYFVSVRSKEFVRTEKVVKL